MNCDKTVDRTEWGLSTRVAWWDFRRQVWFHARSVTTKTTRTQTVFLSSLNMIMIQLDFFPMRPDREKSRLYHIRAEYVPMRKIIFPNKPYFQRYRGILAEACMMYVSVVFCSPPASPSRKSRIPPSSRSVVEDATLAHI